MFRFRALKFALALSFLLVLSTAAFAAETDQQAILDLMSTYGFTYDSKNIEAWINLFTEDAVWTQYSGPNKNLTVQLNGAQAMQDYYAARFATFIQEGIQTRHYQVNTVFTSMKAKTATARTYVQVDWQYASESAPQMVHTGYYEDTFVKTAHGWKFKIRTVYVDHN